MPSLSNHSVRAGKGNGQMVVLIPLKRGTPTWTETYTLVKPSRCLRDGFLVGPDLVRGEQTLGDVGYGA